MPAPADLPAYCLDVAERARNASRQLAMADTEQKNAWLRLAATELVAAQSTILAANATDVAAADRHGLTAAQVDRLQLSPERLVGMAQGLEQVAALPDPIGRVLESRERPNGLVINKVCVPLGVAFFIYESRPNVTADAAAICVKSGNAVILRGGKEAAQSSAAVVERLRDAAGRCGLPPDGVQLVETTDRDAIDCFLHLPAYIDLAIPRGGEGLIRRVVAEARMPVLKHFSGNCHVYVDATADLAMAVAILVDSKCQRMGVCNAAESLLVHASVAAEFLPRVAQALAPYGVEIRGDETTRKWIPSAVAVSAEDLATEFLGPVLSVCVVDTLAQAIEHINRFGSKHTDAIVARDPATIARFESEVDTAAVMVNTSTRFHDGGEFGLGAEIGISTDKFHARGPCGLNELTTYKYLVRGTGQLRG